MFRKYLIRNAFDLIGGYLIAETPVNLNEALTGNNIGNSKTCFYIGDLHWCRRKILVSPVPYMWHQFIQCRYCTVHRVITQMRIGNMPLDSEYTDICGKNSASADFDCISKHLWGAGLPDKTVIKNFITLEQSAYHMRSSVHKLPLLIAGNHQRYFTPVIGMLFHKALGSHHHGRKSALHVCSSPAVYHAVMNNRIKGTVCPGGKISGRYHVGMAEKTENRTSVAVCRVHVGCINMRQIFYMKSRITKFCGYKLLTPLILGSYWRLWHKLHAQRDYFLSVFTMRIIHKNLPVMSRIRFRIPIYALIQYITSPLFRLKHQDLSRQISDKIRDFTTSTTFLSVFWMFKCFLSMHMRNIVNKI